MMPKVSPTVKILSQMIRSPYQYAQMEYRKAFYHEANHSPPVRKDLASKERLIVDNGNSVQTKYYNKYMARRSIFNASAIDNMKSKLMDSHGGINPQQMRFLSTEMHCTDEEEFDIMLHNRELEMHRDPAGPVPVITKLAKKAIRGKGFDRNQDLVFLDIDSQPHDSILDIAREFPDSSAYCLGSSTSSIKSMSDEFLQSKLPLTAQLYNSSDLSGFEDRSIDLVTSCYGLQKCTDPEALIKEVHRVLRPGGTFVVGVWEHLETEPILDQMIDRASKGEEKTGGKAMALTGSHVVDRMIEQSGLWCVDIEHGEYPLCISADGLSGAAFDLISMPIKNSLRKMIKSGKEPYAFEEARAAFDDIVSKGNFIKKDSKGRMVVEDNRYKVLVARRLYEDVDALVDIDKQREKISSISSLSKVITSLHPKTTKRIISSFDALVSETFSNYNTPLIKLSNAMKRTIESGGHNLEKAKIMDLGSHLGVGQDSRNILAEALPGAFIHTGKFLTNSNLVEESKTGTAPKLDIEGLSAKNMQQLATIESESIDLVTCAFGLTFFDDPKATVKEVHRILKPGGSLITLTWNSISLEHISIRIMAQLLSAKGDEQKLVSSSCELMNLTDFAEPRKLERLVEYNGLSVVKSVHYEFPFILSKQTGKGSLAGYLGGRNIDEVAFDRAILPLRHVLESLEESGQMPDASAEARHIFTQMIKNGELVSFDKYGYLVTVPNRFKLMIARRTFENGGDGTL